MNNRFCSFFHLMTNKCISITSVVSYHRLYLRHHQTSFFATSKVDSNIHHAGLHRNIIWMFSNSLEKWNYYKANYCLYHSKSENCNGQVLNEVDSRTCTTYATADSYRLVPANLQFREIIGKKYLPKTKMKVSCFKKQVVFRKICPKEQKKL